MVPEEEEEEGEEEEDGQHLLEWLRAQLAEPADTQQVNSAALLTTKSCQVTTTVIVKTVAWSADMSRTEHIQWHSC